MKRVLVKENQSLLDIALEQYGDVQGVFWLVEDNPNLIGITDNVYKGERLKVREEAIRPRLKDYLKPYAIQTAAEARGEGIGYWAINREFILPKAGN